MRSESKGARETTPITKMMLGGGKHKAAMVSSISEIYGIMPLVKEGLIDDVSLSNMIGMQLVNPCISKHLADFMGRAFWNQ